MLLADLVRQSRLNNRAEYVRKEKDKLGVLRAGSSGIISDNGEIAGACARKAHLRSKGIELDPPTEDKLIMFDLGFASEDIIYKKLVSALPEGHVILREEEIPIAWHTTNGTQVTGRPDIVICRKEELPLADTEWAKYPPVPVLGIELKSTHSVWVAREVVFNRKPKISNLVQAAHYMMRLEVPYKLVYTNYSQLGQGMAGSGWMVKQFPKEGEPGSDFIEYNDKGLPKHIRQFEVIYDLRFDQTGRLEYKLEHETDAQWTKTIVSRDGIESFFEFVAGFGPAQDLGPRPAQVDSIGNKAGYVDCSYCVLEDTCKKTEKLGYEAWFQSVQQFLSIK